MSDVVAFQAPVAVEYDGQALHIVAQLSKLAVELSEIHSAAPPEIKGQLENSMRTLDAVILMMTAVEETISVIETNAEEILSIVNDGEEASFTSVSLSSALAIGGKLKRRCNTLRVQRFDFRGKPVNNDYNDNIRTKKLMLTVGKTPALRKRARPRFI